MKKAILLLVWVLVLSTEGFGQISFGVAIGGVNCLDHGDSYALTTAWPQVPSSTTGNNNTSTNNKLSFGENATGSIKSAFVGWEATEHLAISLLYRGVDMSNSENKRSSSFASYGLQVKLNFVKNTKRVVPFFQAEYYFLNSNKIKQEKVTSTNHPSQTQPAFEKTFSTNLGIGGNLGMEIKLSDSFSLMLMAGVHGVQLADDTEKNFLASLNYGAAFQNPSNIDGTFFMQFSGGIKYYVRSTGKKRDF